VGGLLVLLILDGAAALNPLAFFGKFLARGGRPQLRACPKEVVDMLELNATKLHAIKDEMLLQMKQGLSGTQESPMLMLPTHLSKLPSGAETGSYLALDLGGTNFRVLKVTLHGKGKFDVVNSKHKVDQKLMEGPGEDLFRFFAQKVKEMVPEAVGAATALPLGFTFSFPVLQTSINVGKLVRWTKGFTCTGVEGEDVVALLQKALQVESVAVVAVVLLDGGCTATTGIGIKMVAGDGFISMPVASVGLLIDIVVCGVSSSSSAFSSSPSPSS